MSYIAVFYFLLVLLFFILSSYIVVSCYCFILYVHMSIGPGGVRDCTPPASVDHRYVGDGTMSAEGSSQIDYLWTAPSSVPFPRPRSHKVGEVGWGLNSFSDWSAANTGQQIQVNAAVLVGFQKGRGKGFSKFWFWECPPPPPLSTITKTTMKGWGIWLHQFTNHQEFRPLSPGHYHVSPKYLVSPTIHHLKYAYFTNNHAFQFIFNSIY